MVQATGSAKKFEAAGKGAAEADLEPPVEVDPVAAWIYLSKMESIIKGYKNGLEPHVTEAVDRAGGSISRAGAVLESAEVGVKWDHSGDPVYTHISDKVKEFNDALKARAKETRSLKESRTELNKETGEIIEIPPPVRTSTSKFKLTLKDVENGSK